MCSKKGQIFCKYTNQLIYVLEHHQYATKLMEVLMSGTTVDEYIWNPSMNVMVVFTMSATLEASDYS